MSPTRFTSGVTNAAPQTTLANYGLPDPSSWHSFFTDFDSYTAANWVVTETDAGATEALAAGDGGLLLITNTAADNDLVSLQSLVATFLMEAGKPACFLTRFKVSDATQIDLVVGLMGVDTSPLDDTDGIYFQKDDGDAQIDVICRKNATTGSTTATNVATLVADTYLKLGWFYDGKQAVSFYVNDLEVAQLDASSTYLPDANLAVTFAIQNGEAVAKTMTMDYIFAAKKRTTAAGA